MRLAAPVVLLCLALTAAPAQAADKQFRGFFGATFGGGTTFVDLEKAAGRLNPVIGASAMTLGDMFGVEAEIADAPGFFQAGDQHLVLSSRVTTLNYSTAGLLTSITDADSQEWDYGYDSAARMTSIVDPLTNETAFTYGAGNRVSGVTRADSSTVSLTPAQVRGLAASGTGTSTSHPVR